MSTPATINMVQGVLAPNGIRNDRVLNAFLEVDRGAYVGPECRAAAYCDSNVVDGRGNVVLLHPLTLALMVQHVADWRDSGKVAVLGDDTGYVKTLLGHLHLNAVDAQSEEDLHKGTPFDAILVNGAVAEDPRYLTPFLTKEGCVLALVQPQHTNMGAVKAIYADEALVLGQAASPYFDAFRPDEAFAL